MDANKNMTTKKQTSFEAFKKLPTPLLRLNSDPKILPSSEEMRQLEAFSSDNDYNSVNKLRSQLESGSVRCGQFLETGLTSPRKIINKDNINEPVTAQNKRQLLLVKQKSLGRTLSTSVLRIKKKRSFWSNEKFKQ